MNLFTAIQIARTEIATNLLDKDNTKERTSCLNAAYDVLASKHAEMREATKDVA